LKIEVNLSLKTGNIELDGKFLGQLDEAIGSNNGQFIQVDQANTLFIKFINSKEGFTVMLNDRHIIASAGHPKKLLQKTL